MSAKDVFRNCTKWNECLCPICDFQDDCDNEHKLEMDRAIEKVSDNINYAKEKSDENE